jgi:hypothetical protein
MLYKADRRFWLFFLPLFAIGLLTLGLDGIWVWTASLWAVLYLAMVIAGAGLAYLNWREGYCMNRPYINRFDHPIMYWLELSALLLMLCAGLRGLWKLVS